MHIKYFIIAPIYCLLLSGCDHNKRDLKIYKDSSGKVNEIFIPESKADHLGIKFGSIIQDEFENQIFCEGIVYISPENIKNITAPFEGEIVKIFCNKGTEISSGLTLAYIENNAFIELQQQYLDARNQYDYFKEEYTRQGELTIESATSVKKMQIAQRDFQAAELKYNSTSLQLKTLGINPTALENNNIMTSLPIYTNQKGKVSNILIHTGDFVKKGELLFEITRNNILLVKLFIPERYYKLIRIGQSVDCFIASDSLSSSKAEITGINEKIDPNTYTFEVVAHFKNQNQNIISGMSVKAKINVVRDSLHLVKNTSILETPEGNFIFIKNNGKYIKYPINTGISLGNNIEIEDIPQNLKDSIVISGLKRLNALFNNP